MILVLLNFANLIRENLYLSICICIYFVKLFLSKCLLVICFLFPCELLFRSTPLFSHKVPLSTGLNSTPALRGIPSPATSKAVYNSHLLSTTITHLIRYDVFISNYIRDHLVFIFGSTGRQRNRCNKKNSIPKAKHHPSLNQWASKKKNHSKGTSLAIQRLRLCASNAKGMDSIPCRN